MARRHPIAVAIKQHASEEARLPSFSALALGGVAGKLRLHGIPERLIDNRLVFAKMGLLVVDDLAAIDAVLPQHITSELWYFIALLQSLTYRIVSGYPAFVLPTRLPFAR